MVIRLEGQAELVVEDPQIAISIAGDRLRHHRPHFLCDDADVGVVAAIVAEAVEADAVVQTAEQDDVMLEPDIGPAAAAAAAAPAAPARAAADTLGPAVRGCIAPRGGMLVSACVLCDLAVSAALLVPGVLLGARGLLCTIV